MTQPTNKVPWWARVLGVFGRAATDVSQGRDPQEAVTDAVLEEVSNEVNVLAPLRQEVFGWIDNQEHWTSREKATAMEAVRLFEREARGRLASRLPDLRLS